MYSPLHSSSFWRTAAVMWNWRDVANRAHFKTSCLQRPNSRVPAGTRAFYVDLKRTHARFASAVRGRHGCLLGSERGSLTRSFKTERAGTRPANNVAFHVGDRHNGVVE